MVEALRLQNGYKRPLKKPTIAPALIVASDIFKGLNSNFKEPNIYFREPQKRYWLPYCYIQQLIKEAAIRVVPFVSSIHVDINCKDYIDDHPDNNEIFSPLFLYELKSTLGRTHYPPLFDVHILGRNILEKASNFLGIADHVSFEMEVVEEEQQNFAKALDLLKAREMSAGIIGVIGTKVDQYLPYFKEVDVLGVTASDKAGRTKGNEDLQSSLAKVGALRERGFSGNVVFQVGVTSKTIVEIGKAGANILVCGSEIFKPPMAVAPAMSRLNGILIESF